ncbi:SRPBCC domain-containing protein [Brachybacterium sp. EF45031]|uniref:SRPBCC domain-containing protein n=1 Tax=Brachybacterium sillae TaxID=2810536 RepID=UPI00217E253A|nr:SRPBCC domain-containing protein [Brachybacterium sillae]MCS6712274.1 SRPBCC domain-containing protein [Brachybacterium sillae]
MPETATAPAIDAVTRTVDLMPEDDRLHVRTTLRTNLAVPAARVWPLLTDPAELATWYGPVQGDLREGGAFTALGGASGRILRVEEPHRLSLTWEYAGQADPLELFLDPEDDGTTELRLVHEVTMAQEVFDRFGPGATAVGWDLALLGLAARTEGWRTTCQALVPVPGPAWLVSEEGREYVRAWSIRWAAASIAAGTDETAARRAEAETTRAYGGETAAVPAS